MTPTQTTRTRRSGRWILAVSLFAVAVLFVGARVVNAEEEISPELRQALTVPLQDRVKELKNEKDDDPFTHVRGSYLKNFKQVDNDTYQVTLHKNITDREEFKTERYLLTLRREGSDKWAIAEEQLERTVEGLMYRPVPDDETFHSFDSFSFELEGIKVSARNGSVVVDYRRGKPNVIGIASENMKYEYAPPEDLPYGEIMPVVRELYPDEIVFDPKLFVLACTPDCEQLLADSFKGLADATEDSLPSELKRNLRDQDNRQTEAYKQQPLAGFTTETRHGRRVLTVNVMRKKGPDHWAGMNFDTHDAKEVTFWVARKGPVYRYNSAEVRKQGRPPEELERLPDLDAMDYDVASLTGTVEMAIDSAETITCDLEYVLNIRRDIEYLPFVIGRLPSQSGQQRPSARLSLDLVEDAAGHELTYVRASASSGLIVFPETIAAGEQVKLHVRFENTGSLIKLNPHFSYVDRQGWLPLVRFGDMIDNVDMAISAPRRYTILGIGREESSTVKGDVRTAKFVSDQPVTFPTVIFGDYISAKSKVEAKKLDGTKIPVNVYVDQTSTYETERQLDFSDANRVNQQDVVDREMARADGDSDAGTRGIRPKSLAPLAAQAANALNLYSAVYGVDYPFAKLDLVNDPGFQGILYGQAPASIVYLGFAAFRSATFGSEMGVTGAAEFQEGLVAHEVGHQWWGSLIAHANYRNYWFVESLAEYSSALFVENLLARESAEEGRQAYLQKVEGWRKRLIDAGLLTSVQDATSVWAGETPDANTAAIYAKGPYAFHILRSTFPDQFMPFLKKLATELAGKEIITRDIQRVAEDSFGGTMEWFFDQWIRGVGIPEYSFNYKARQAEDRTYIVEGTIKQRIVVGKDKHPLEGKTFRGVVTITVLGTDKQEYPVRMLVEKEETPFAFKVPVEPLEVAFNKYGGVLAHDVLVNQSF